MADNADTVDRLRQVDLFSSLSGRQLKHLASVGQVLRHDPGYDVVIEGHGGVGFHLILSGEATVQVGGAARPALGPGEYFGEISVLDGHPRSATVTAGDAGLETFSLSAWQFAALLEKNPEMAMPIITGLCARLRAVEAAAAR